MKYLLTPALLSVLLTLSACQAEPPQVPTPSPTKTPPAGPTPIAVIALPSVKKGFKAHYEVGLNSAHFNQVQNCYFEVTAESAFQINVQITRPASDQSPALLTSAPSIEALSLEPERFWTMVAENLLESVAFGGEFQRGIPPSEKEPSHFLAETLFKGAPLTPRFEVSANQGITQLQLTYQGPEIPLREASPPPSDAPNQSYELKVKRLL